jgi:hypothetical protein
MRIGETPVLAVASAFLAVIPTLSVAEGEEPASRLRSKRLFFFSPNSVISTGA